MGEYQQVEVRKPGDEITLTVEQVFFNPKTATHKYPDFTFRGQAAQGPVMVYVPENACRRQFSRLKMEPEAAVRETIRFWRGENAGDESKPYWNIDIATPADTKPKPASKRIAAPTAVPGEGPPAHHREIPLPLDEAPYTEGPVGHSLAEQKMAAVEVAYARAWRCAVETQGTDGTPESYQSGAATILIQFEKVGALR